MFQFYGTAQRIILHCATLWNGSAYTEAEMSSRWQPWYSPDTLGAVALTAFRFNDRVKCVLYINHIGFDKRFLIPNGKSDDPFSFA